MLTLIKNNKKLILTILFICLVPFILPIINILVEIIFETGKIFGSFVRNFTLGNICL